MRALVGALTPIIQTRVGRVLLKFSRGQSPDRVRQEVLDLTQEAFAALFADNARALRSWNPERGLSLANFVGLVAHRKALSLMRRHKHNPFTEDPTPNEDFEWLAPSDDATPESVTMSRQVSRQVLQKLDDTLTPKGRELFDLLVIQELPVEDVAARLEMKPPAIYMWRSRLLKSVREHARSLLLETPGLGQIPELEGAAP